MENQIPRMQSEVVKGEGKGAGPRAILEGLKDKGGLPDPVDFEAGLRKTIITVLFVKAKAADTLQGLLFCPPRPVFSHLSSSTPHPRCSWNIPAHYH
jgi:hypothetical protein